MAGGSSRPVWGAQHALLRALSLLGLVLAAGCASAAQLDAYVGQIEQALLEAEAAGAMNCAPRELAMARSHLRFAQLEREQGFPKRARQHLDVADENARGAQVLSPAGHCSPRAAPNSG